MSRPLHPHLAADLAALGLQADALPTPQAWASLLAQLGQRYGELEATSGRAAQHSREMAELIPRAELRVISSPHGHDSFLIHIDELNRIVSDFVRRG